MENCVNIQFISIFLLLRLIKMNMHDIHIYDECGSAMYLQCRKLREIRERVVGEDIYAIIAEI